MSVLTTLLGITHPIIQAPMAGVQTSALAIAVSAAGALGSLPCAMLSHDALRSELTKLKSSACGPYNVNFFCHTPPTPDAAVEQRWRDALAPYYSEFEIDPADAAPEQPRAPFSAELAELLSEFTPPVVSFHFGLPSPDLLARVRSWGAKVVGCATTVEEARWLESHGVDAIIAQGVEAGGHRGLFLKTDLATQLPTATLVTQIVAAVRVPAIAAGGIADAAGVRAMMALGAAGAQIGTAYMLCDEATTKPMHRLALQSPAAQHTALTNLFSGRPARGIVNRLMRELGPLSTLAPDFPLASAALAPLRAAAEQQGSGDFSPLWSGQNTLGCQAISAAELTRQLAG
jgi:nitronate monooxygenase